VGIHVFQEEMVPRFRGEDAPKEVPLGCAPKEVLLGDTCSEVPYEAWDAFLRRGIFTNNSSQTTFSAPALVGWAKAVSDAQHPRTAEKRLKCPARRRRMILPVKREQVTPCRDPE
jgi:hypothetical protein